MNSMTGFGRIDVPIDGGQLQWEIRSVNHRYLEIQLKLPDGFRAMETSFREAISDHIKRGKVDATLAIKKGENNAPSTNLNLERAREVIAQFETVAAEIKGPAAISPLDVIRAPGVLEEEVIDPESLGPVVIDSLRSAVALLCESRAREGEKLQRVLVDRCVEIEALVDATRKRLPTVLAEIRKKLEQRIESLQAKLDNERLEQEVVIIAQKLDVTEELDRLVAHIEEVRNTFTENEPIGRRLDFLMQELNREANTLGSKSADTETTQQVVDLKVLIEQMREQVQNIE